MKRLPSRVPACPSRRLILLAVVVGGLLSAGLAVAAPPPKEKAVKGKRPATPRLLAKIEKVGKAGGRPARVLRPFDQPAEAQAFFLKKRSSDGVSPISAEKYFAARERLTGMPLYSTAAGTFTGPSAGRPDAPENASLAPWQNLGPGNVGGRTRAILVHPTTPSILWAAGVAGGIWKSTNAGASWQPLADLMANLAVTTLAMTPGQPETIYAGTGEGFDNLDAVRGAGIFKTTDGGANWNRLPATATPDFHYVQKIVVSPNDGQRVYAATSTGVHRSIDGGTTWTNVRPATTGAGFMDLVIRTDTATDVVFASEGNFGAAKVYRNVDAGGAGAWDVVLADGAFMGRTSLAIAPSNQDVVYALSASNEAGNFQDGLYKVFRSTTGGASGSWTARWTQDGIATKLGNLLLTNPVIANLVPCGYDTSNGFYNQGWYDNVIAVDPTDSNVVWAGGIDLFRSSDGGQTWGIASYWWAETASLEYNHADHHAIVFHPDYDGVSNQTMYVGNDGGVYRTENAKTGTVAADVCGNSTGTLAWTNLNNNYGVTQFYHGTVFPDGNTFFGGTQDNGTVRGTVGAGVNAWSPILGGDGGYVAVDPGNTNVLFAENTGLSIVKSTNGGASWAPATAGITESEDHFLFIAPYAMDPSSAQTLWIGGWYPWRTTNGATGWTRAGDFLPGEESASAVAVAPTDSNYVLFGMSDGWIARNTAALSAGSGTTWPSVQPRTGYCSSVAFDPTNKNVAYATYSTFGGSHVWKSIDAGATWSPIDGTEPTRIPDIPVHSVVVSPSNSQRLYVGTDIGVFVSLDGGASWAVENMGFANVVTESLLTRSGFLYAFTHGRGAYRVSLSSPACAVPPTATVSGSAAICTPGGSTNLSVALTGTGPWNLTWSDGFVQNGVAASPAQRTVSPATTTTYWVMQVTTESGACVVPGTGSATVTLGTAPAAPALSAPATVEAGSTGNVASVPAAPGLAWSWAVTNGSITSGQGSNQITFTAGTYGTATVSVTASAGGCTSPASQANVFVTAPYAFFTLTPCRVVNTRRSDYGALGAPSIGAAGSPDRSFALTSGSCGIPATAKAVSINMTVAETAGAGYLTLYPGTGSVPASSSINFALGQVKANNAILPLASDGTGTIRVRSGATGTVNLLIDVHGYFE